MVWLPYSLRMVLVWTTLVPALRLLELWEWVCCVVSAWRAVTGDTAPRLRVVMGYHMRCSAT